MEGACERTDAYIPYNARMESGFFQCGAGIWKTWGLVVGTWLSSCVSLGVVSLCFFFPLPNTHFPLLSIIALPFLWVTAPSPVSVHPWLRGGIWIPLSNKNNRNWVRDGLWPKLGWLEWILETLGKKVLGKKNSLLHGKVLNLWMAVFSLCGSLAPEWSQTRREKVYKKRKTYPR